MFSHRHHSSISSGLFLLLKRFQPLDQPGNGTPELGRGTHFNKLGDILVDWPLFPCGERSEMIETLDEVRASAEFEIFREVAKDEQVIERTVAAQREELEREWGQSIRINTF